MNPEPATEFLDRVIAGLPGAPAPTEWRRQFFAEWARWEQGRVDLDYWNPLNTTQHEPGSTPLGGDPNQNNGNPVQEYPNEGEGVDATDKTLANGYYPHVLATIMSQEIQPGTADDVALWGTSGFATTLRNGWQPSGSKEVNDMMSNQERWLIGVASGDYDRMLGVYDALVADGHLPADLPPTHEDGSIGDLSEAVVKRFRIINIVCALAPADLAALVVKLGGPS
jgi:hypothetical protein